MKKFNILLVTIFSLSIFLGTTLTGHAQVKEAENNVVETELGNNRTEYVVNDESFVIKTLTREEAKGYMGNDYLLISDGLEENSELNRVNDIQSYSSFQSRASIKKIALYVGGVFVGWMLEKGFEYVAAKITIAGIKAVIATIVGVVGSPAFIFGTLAVITMFALSTIVVNSRYKYNYAKSSSGCIQYTPGTNWVCPRIAE